VTQSNVLNARREGLAAAWNLSDEIVLFVAGERIGIPGTDAYYPFRAHPEFRYLTDLSEPGCVLAYDAAEGWTLFVPEPSPEDRFWDGVRELAGTPRSQLHRRISGRTIAVCGCALDGVSSDAALAARCSAAVSAARRTKDAAELARLRRAVAITADAFAVVRDAVQPGVTERELQVELETAFLRGGADGAAFDTIVAAGRNASVLHFAPGDTVVREGELLLIDAGAEFEGYGADVTRTWNVGDHTLPEKRDLYALMREVQAAAVAKCVPGKEYKEIHLEACVQLARGFVDFKLLKGDPEALVEKDAHALFFPHGIGHLLGLGVHDAGGYAPGRTRSSRFGLKFLRADLPLQTGYVVTIEPGLYFIESLLTDPERRDIYASDVNWDRADVLRDFGGIRIEDDILVTDGAPENLTEAIPKGLAG